MKTLWRRPWLWRFVLEAPNNNKTGYVGRADLSVGVILIPRGTLHMCRMHHFDARIAGKLRFVERKNVSDTVHLHCSHETGVVRRFA